MGLENSSTKIIPIGTLLIAMYGQGITRGRVALTGIEATFNQACAAIFPFSKISSSEYIYYYMTFQYDFIRSLGHGANQRNLNTNIIKTITIPLPKIHIQKNIVNSLNKLDAKIIVSKSLLNIYQGLFFSVLNQLMTGKIRVKDIEFEIEKTLDKVHSGGRDLGVG